MAEQWIPAHKALEIVKSEVMLTSALRSGLIKAQAGMIHTSDNKYAQNPIRAEFWRVDRQHKFAADWQTGYFSNVFDGAVEVNLYGLTIELSGLLQLVHADERGLISRSLSVAGNPEWLSALEARTLCYSVVNPIRAGNWLLEQARLGFVTARAVKAEMNRIDYGKRCIWSEREWDVPIWFWENFTKATESNQDWDIGRFSGRGKSPDAFGEIILSGLYFHAQTLRQLTGQTDNATDDCTHPSEINERKGRRTKYDWFAATSAVWGKLYRNDLLPLPEHQADIEKAMIEVLRVGDKEPSESTVRPYAKYIFEEYQKP